MKFVSIDSSLANTGVAWGEIKDDGTIHVLGISLHETTKTKSKQVRASSDTIDRCKSTHQFIKDVIGTTNPQVLFVETPSGSQNSSAMKSYGATCQLIATLSPDPIQVTPNEVKMSSVGKKTASKVDMMNWARSLYPDVQWDLNKDGSMKAKNEHMADAIAIVHAGVKTPEFNRLQNLLK